MPEDITATKGESQAAPSPELPAAAAEAPSGLNPGLALLFVVIVVLVGVQNVWLRRRAEREARSEEDAG